MLTNVINVMYKSVIFLVGTSHSLLIFTANIAVVYNWEWCFTENENNLKNQLNIWSYCTHDVQQIRYALLKSISFICIKK